MQILRMIIRVLTLGLATLGLSSLSFIVLSWLHVEDDKFLALWFTGGSFLIVFACYLLYAPKIPKADRRAFGPGLVPGVIVALGVAAFIGFMNYETSADIPRWLNDSVPAFSFMLMAAIIREWAQLDYMNRKERGEMG